MSAPVLESKLFVPTTRPDTVRRPRLVDRLTREAGRLTLISAPAGFGKTTLLGCWLDADPAAGSVAWVSLDATDANAHVFWSDVVTALDRAVPGVGTEVLPALAAGREATTAVLSGLLNELTVLPLAATLVLDDYHLADGPGIRPGVTFLLEHLPPHIRLVISTRADPALPLARLRARGELTEVRAADLRFTSDEAAQFLHTSGLELSTSDVRALEERTEGWAAALHLAALSLRGRDDATTFIAGFAGDDRFLVDYLVEEVLDRQSHGVRQFLLRTSILERLTGTLCDAVTATTGGSSMLAQLDRANLFLVPLDSQRHWYRYHQLFRDLLQTRLLDTRQRDSRQLDSRQLEELDDVRVLHRRASRWHELAADPVSAVRHALVAGDVERAADLVELAVPQLRRHRRESTLLQWIGEIPEDVVEQRPVLGMGFVGALMAGNHFYEAGQRLRAIERSLDSSPDMVVVDHREQARLPGCVELYRAALALVGGDPPATLDHAHRAAALAPEDDDLTRASAAALVGLASWTTGDLDAAHRSYAGVSDALGRLGHLSDVMGCSITLADIEITRGQLRKAQATYERALRLGTDDPEITRGTADVLTGLAQVALERHDLAGAAEHLRQADALDPSAALPQHAHRWRVALALLREAEGDTGAALALLREAEHLYTGDFQPNHRPIEAIRARVHAAHGDVAAALSWAQARDMRVDDELHYLQEYEHVTLARILLAQHARDGAADALADARRLLERLLVAADRAARNGTVIEVLALLALAHQATGDQPEAIAAFERALLLAEPEDFSRVFLAEGGGSTTALLEAVCRHRRGWDYPRRLVDRAKRPSSGRSVSDPAPVAAPTGLVEPLTGREQDVMRLLASELDGPSIARELVVSLNTVRTHTKNIYAKLGVTSRRAAVSRAHQLRLPPSLDRR